MLATELLVAELELRRVSSGFIQEEEIKFCTLIWI